MRGSRGRGTGQGGGSAPAAGGKPRNGRGKPDKVAGWNARAFVRLFPFSVQLPDSPFPTMSKSLSGHFDCARLVRFSLPAVATVLSMSVYGIVDGFFLSNWAGKEAFAAANLIWPYAMILGAFGAMLGTGGNALVAIRLGQGRTRSADRPEGHRVGPDQVRRGQRFLARAVR